MTILLVALEGFSQVCTNKIVGEKNQILKDNREKQIEFSHWDTIPDQPAFYGKGRIRLPGQQKSIYWWIAIPLWIVNRVITWNYLKLKNVVN